MKIYYILPGLLCVFEHIAIVHILPRNIALVPISLNVGAAVTFIPVQDITLLCFHLGLVLFGAYFPFYAREFDAKGRTKYIHITAVASAILIPALIVGIQFAMGGYRRTMVPIFCLADTGSTFVFSIVPVCILSAVFLTLVMLLFFKTVRLGGCQYITKKVSPHTHVLLIGL